MTFAWGRFLTLVLAKQYGDVFSVKVFDKTIIVLNSPTLVKEVYEKYSHSSSNRPQSTIHDMLIPDRMNPGTTRYGGIYVNFTAVIYSHKL